jgi:hypothetical protein
VRLVLSAVLLALAPAAPAFAQHDPPRLILHGRYWNAIPGWQPGPQDIAYIEFTPTGDVEADVQAIAKGDLLDVPAPQRMLGTNAVRHTAAILEGLQARDFLVGSLGYDLELRPQTPREEQQDPVAACAKARALAQRFSAPLLLVPTAGVSTEWGEKLAPLVDWFQPQGKAYQAYDTSLAVYRQREMYRKLRAANAKLVFFHDTAIVPKGKDLPLSDLLDYYYGCSDMVAGVSIWALPRHLPMLRRYVLTLRPPETPPPGVQPPVIRTPASVSRAQALVGETLKFSVEAEDPEGDELEYTWDFGDHREWGDGNVLVRGRDAAHAYLKPGDYTATVTVTDGKGGCARSRIAVSVTHDPPAAPPRENP